MDHLCIIILIKFCYKKNKKKKHKKYENKCITKKGTFFDQSFIQKFGDHWYIEWRLKSRYTRQKLEIKKDETKHNDVASWWYQNWSVHGLRESKQNNSAITQFVGIHNNIYIGGTAREKCEERIALYIYCDDDINNKINTMKINGINLKSNEECQRIRAEKTKRKKMRNIHLYNAFSRKRTRREMEQQEEEEEEEEDDDDDDDYDDEQFAEIPVLGAIPDLIPLNARVRRKRTRDEMEKEDIYQALSNTSASSQNNNNKNQIKNENVMNLMQEVNKYKLLFEKEKNTANGIMQKLMEKNMEKNALQIQIRQLKNRQEGVIQHLIKLEQEKVHWSQEIFKKNARIFELETEIRLMETKCIELKKEQQKNDIEQNFDNYFISPTQVQNNMMLMNKEVIIKR